MYTRTQSGYISYKKKGKLDFLDIESHYNPKSSANILAFHKLNKIPGAHMYYNGAIEDVFELRYKNGRKIRFPNDGNGLYFYQCIRKEKASQKVAQYLQTVEEKIDS